MKLYDNVKKLADLNGKSIRQIEREAGLSNGTIGKWREMNGASLINAAKVAKVLDVQLEELMT